VTLHLYPPTDRTPNKSDSWELNYLRLRCRRDRRWDGMVLTPLRLGAAAHQYGLAITDFGAHSKRWRRLFDMGIEQAKKFNP
jgi:hypothetical protein